MATIERDSDYRDWADEFFYERRQDYVVSADDGIPCCGEYGFCGDACRTTYEAQFSVYEGDSCPLSARPAPIDADDILF